MQRFRWGFVVYLIAIAGSAAVLLAARHASHRLVHDFLCADFFDAKNAYLVVHPWAFTDVAEPLRPTLAEVRDHFAQLTERLPINRPPPLLYPLACVAGLMEIRAILLASLAVAMIPSCWSRRRRSIDRPKPRNPLPRMD